MAEGTDIPAWIALFFGIYAVSASLGEFVRPGTWSEMLKDFAVNAGLRFLAGIGCLAIGTAVYLSSPWQPDDWLSVVVTVMGAGMVLEGALFLAVGGPFMDFSRRLIGTANRGWAIFSGLFGIAFIIIALMRI